MNARSIPTFFLIVIIVTSACRTSSKPGLFGRKTPHEQYGKKITDAGLHSTSLGRSWFQAAESALTTPVNIGKPHKETGFFSAQKPTASGLRFNATRGEKIVVSVSKKPTAGFKLYLDLWESDTSIAAKPKLLASSDTTGQVIEHEVEKTGVYILRLQPELLQDCEYTVEISSAASLAFPIRAPGKNHIRSFWGAARDAGARKHEGIDIFASRGTPVVAAADGRVTRVNENNLGGKVVWMRPERKSYTLYYAHLDSQLVTDGQQVQAGDTLGLMGNTGNARTTPPHLHFGIYAYGGAIDPLPFVNPDYPDAPAIRSDTNAIGEYLRITTKTSPLYFTPSSKSTSVPLKRNTLFAVEAATGNWYRVRLPDGTSGYVASANTGPLSPLRSFTPTRERRLLSAPDSLGPSRKLIAPGKTLRVLAEFKDFQYVRSDDDEMGWLAPDSEL